MDFNYTIIKETEKARLAEFTASNGQVAQVWCPKRNAGLKFEDAVQMKISEKDRELTFNLYDEFKVVKETEKAVLFRVPVDLYDLEKDGAVNVWMPKSMVRKQDFFESKVEESVRNFYGRNGYYIKYSNY